MAYYHLPTDVARNPGRLEQKVSDGAWLSAPDGVWTAELAALCGFIPIVETPKPADTQTTTTDRTVQLVDGTPTVVWVERAWSQSELDAKATSANSDLIRSQAEAALANNGTYLAITSPSQAQVVAQVNALTRQVNKLIRLALGKFDGTD